MALMANPEGTRTMRTPKEMLEQIVDKAGEDADFRAHLLGDPKGAVEQELNVRIPASMSVEVHENSGTTTHLVLPPDSRLSESDLEAVAGGALDWESVREAMDDW